MCGVKGIYDELKNSEKQGMFITVSGNIPPAAGLSSSSALVSAATLATSFINQVWFAYHPKHNDIFYLNNELLSFKYSIHSFHWTKQT